MTLRELTYMANAKREHDYNVASATIQYFSAMWNGDKEGLRNNPYRDVAPKSDEDMKEETGSAWKFLRRGLRFLAGK